MAEFSNLMLRARESADKSLRELSSIVGVSAGQLSNYERGVSVPKREVVIAIADALDIPTDFALMVAGYAPVYYNAADQEAAQVAEEHSNYFTRISSYEDIVNSIDDLVGSVQFREIQAAVLNAKVLQPRLSAEKVATFTKLEIAIKLFKEAQSEL
ncbi:helix-turn-helix domain-containing protein [Paenibacillus sp. B-A-8]|uniref:helix-turn-helix domain-containing protein n=1 Tax=Paenibacillus sp. B-A-8 TaxID=3400419 RepID=UPI003B0105B4